VRSLGKLTWVPKTLWSMVSLSECKDEDMRTADRRSPKVRMMDEIMAGCFMASFVRCAVITSSWVGLARLVMRSVVAVGEARNDG